MDDAPTPTDRRLSPIVRLAPAKLNLTLAVLGRRADGYHDLHSVMVPLALSDRLSVAPAHGPADTLGVSGRSAGPESGNLVLQAFSAARNALRGQIDAVPLAARLEKHIPVAAGLGGGSSDAVAALDGAFEVWGADSHLDPVQRAAIRIDLAARLGSDVPFFLTGRAATISGRGEVVRVLPPLRGTSPGVLLITPAVAAATASVFTTLDRDPLARPTNSGSARAASEHLAGEWRAGLRADALVVRAGVLASANDLAAAADLVVPGLRALRRSLVRRLGRPVGLSGSGPTLWVLYASWAEAATAAEAVSAGLADGSIVAPGGGGPSIIATTISTPAPLADRSEEEEPR
ncbi:MAG: 4-(cytidine 5'-diphospho)-2-C-methyl-D-erythritol kinase [Chloroflexi bacterium]|nr:4-(cytidine 5'-diphospho)-2-C-methyl-D-erythritol kinase [Chloroflexota bacterium]